MAGRLEHLRQLLDGYQEQIQGMEDARMMASAMDKARININIRATRKEMRPVEQEYWDLLSKAAQTEPIVEAEAEKAIVEVIQAIDVLESRPVDDRSEAMMQMLREIRDKLNEPGNPAAAKLKGMISMLPPFVSLSYEAELDTEQFFSKYFPTAKRVLEGIRAKK